MDTVVIKYITTLWNIDPPTSALSLYSDENTLDTNTYF